MRQMTKGRMQKGMMTLDSNCSAKYTGESSLWGKMKVKVHKQNGSLSYVQKETTPGRYKIWFPHLQSTKCL